MIFHQFRLAVLLLAMGLSGCLSSGSSTDKPSGEDPVTKWDSNLIANHLTFFNGQVSEGRETGKRGFFRSADYVSGYLRDVRLQPVLQGEYRVQFALKLWSFDRIRLFLASEDTLNLVQGQDYLAFDPFRSKASSSSRLSDVFPETDQSGTQRLVTLSNDVTVLHSARITSLLEQNRYTQQIEATGSEQVTTSGMLVSGFVTGSSRRRKDSLIVVFAPLDGQGMQGLISYSDGSDLALAPSALLDVARRLSELQEKWAFLGPSVLFQFSAATLQDCQGPSAAFRNLPWDKTKVLGVVVMADSEKKGCDWHQIIRDEGVEAPVSVLSPSLGAIDTERNEGTTLPYYPFIRRETYLNTPSLTRLTAAATDLADRSFSSILSY